MTTATILDTERRLTNCLNGTRLHFVTHFSAILQFLDNIFRDFFGRVYFPFNSQHKFIFSL